MTHPGLRPQSGLTMVELLVSLVLASLVTLAAIALYSVTLSSYKTVDAGQEIQESGRFALEIIGQAARLAGYQNYTQRQQQRHASIPIPRIQQARRPAGTRWLHHRLPGHCPELS